MNKKYLKKGIKKMYLDETFKDDLTKYVSGSFWTNDNQIKLFVNKVCFPTF